MVLYYALYALPIYGHAKKPRDRQLPTVQVTAANFRARAAAAIAAAAKVAQCSPTARARRWDEQSHDGMRTSENLGKVMENPRKIVKIHVYSWENHLSLICC
jgi:hypothetical protein